jgi:hypothetical protein
MLLYIHKIEWCEAYHLQSALLMPHDRQAILRDVAPWRTLPIVGLAALETSEEMENGVRLHTTKLSATLEETFVFPERPVAFLASSVNGSRVLIGTAQRPFPLVNQNSVLPSNSTENCITELVVTLSSNFSIFRN